jgi:hypothetical protein
MLRILDPPSNLYRGASDPAKAAEHLAIATAMCPGMGMNFWLEKAKAARGSLQRVSP